MDSSLALEPLVTAVLVHLALILQPVEAPTCFMLVGALPFVDQLGHAVRELS